MNAAGLRPRRSTRFALVAALVALLSLLVGPAVVAAQDGGSVDVLNVDLRNEDSTSLRLYTGADAPEVSLTVNGEDATVGANRSIDDGGIAASTVLVIDNAEVNADSLDELKTAALNYVSQRASNERIAIMTTGARAQSVQGFTQNASSLSGAIDRISPNGSSALWDTMLLAGSVLEEQAAVDRFPSVVVLAAGGDTVSVIRPDRVQGLLRNSGALLHVAGITVRNFPGPELDRIVASSGGSYIGARESADYLTAANSLPARVQGVYDVVFRSTNFEAGNVMVVTADGNSRRISFAQNSLTLPGAMTPPELSEPNKYALLQGNMAVYLGIAVAAVAVALGAWTVGNVFGGGDTGLNSVLSAYDGSAAGAATEEEHSIANSVIFQRALALTENIAEKQGFLATTEQRLEQADLPLKAAEALMMWIGAAILMTGFGFVLVGGYIGTAIFAVIGIVLPHFVLKFLAARRKKQFVAALPETLQLLAGTLKAGYSFVQGIESVSRESEGPISVELRKIVTEAQLGLPLEDAMEMSAERIGSDDWAWAIMAVKIQREVGGNLAELLMTVSDTMVARERLRRDVLALTAEGRISALVLGALPLLLAIAMYFLNPDYISQLWRVRLGNIFLAMGVTSALIGFAWMKKTIEIEI